MKRSALRIAEDIVPVTELKAHAGDWLKIVSERDIPLVVTQHGRPAAVLLSPRAYDELIARAELVEAVEEGLRDVEAGRTIPHAQVVAEMAARYGKKPR